MPRYKITIAYDGTDFHGWQRQQDTRDEVNDTQSDDLTPHRPLRTVQEALEHAVREVVREPVTVVGASRTDSGVHARGQVAAFTTSHEIPVEKLPRAITSRLPGDVLVKHAEIVAEAFDPIRDAIAKGYRYRLVHSCATERRPMFDRNFVTSTAYPLDPARMNEAARLLIGEHDFASFTRIAHGRESTVRAIYQCKVDVTSRRRCHIEVVGNGFLYNMVRIIAGTLLEVGRGAMEPSQIPAILDAKDRRAAGPTLAPNGLCLMWIRYPETESPKTRRGPLKRAAPTTGGARMSKRIMKIARSKREWFQGRHRFEHWAVDNQMYFITARCRDKFPAFALEEAKNVFWKKFEQYAKQYEFFPWVVSLLDNHYHMLGYLRHGKNLSVMMQRLHGSVAKLVNDLLSERFPKFFSDSKGREYFDGCLRDELQCSRAFRYTYTQCRRHGICDDPHEYPHTRVYIELERGMKRALELGAFMADVPYPRYARNRRSGHGA